MILCNSGAKEDIIAQSRREKQIENMANTSLFVFLSILMNGITDNANIDDELS